MRGQLTASCHCTPASRKAVGNPPGRPKKNMAALVAVALNETGPTPRTEIRRITEREAVIVRLVNKSTLADERGPPNMLIYKLWDIERRAAPAPAEKSSFSPTNKRGGQNS